MQQPVKSIPSHTSRECAILPATLHVISSLLILQLSEGCALVSRCSGCDLCTFGCRIPVAGPQRLCSQGEPRNAICVASCGAEFPVPKGGEIPQHHWRVATHISVGSTTGEAPTTIGNRWIGPGRSFAVIVYGQILLSRRGLIPIANYMFQRGGEKPHGWKTTRWSTVKVCQCLRSHLAWALCFASVLAYTLQAVPGGALPRGSLDMLTCQHCSINLHVMYVFQLINTTGQLMVKGSINFNNGMFQLQDTTGHLMVNNGK